MRRKPLLIISAALLCVASVAAPASAHFITSGYHFTYQSHEQCVKNAADLGHPPAGGAFKGMVESWSWLSAPWRSQDCAYRVEDPIAVRNVAWKWNGSAWDLCFLSEWANVYTHSLINLTQFNSPPCGSGYYINDSDGFVWHNNQWVGGNFQTYLYTNPAYHWLPS